MCRKREKSAHSFLREENKKMECVAYMRVSTEKQAEEGNGLDSQRRDIQAYAGKNGMLISDWYIDDGYTGANMDRPALQRLINDCYTKKVKNVLAFKLDRLSRSMVDGIYIIEKIFIPNNVNFQCVHDSINYDSPMEQAYTQMMAVFAQLDKNTMLLRMRGGMLERIKQGYWMGGGNLPYCYTYDKEQGILVPIEERKKQANQAINMFIQGYSDEKIMNILGFKNEMTVRNLLTSVVNIGKIPYKGNVYQGLHEPIFDEEKFNYAQKVREQRRKKRMYTAHEANLLTGLCYCGVCGCAMRYQKWTHGKHKIYCCSRNKGLSKLPNYNSDCNNTLEWAVDIEKQVEDKILEISLNIDNISKEKKVDIMEVLNGKLESVNNKLKRMYNLYAEGNDTIIEAIQELEKQKSEIKEDIEEELKKNIAKTNRAETIKEIKKIADVWERIDKKGKNLVLKSIIDKIMVDKGNIEIRLKNF